MLQNSPQRQSPPRKSSPSRTPARDEDASASEGDRDPDDAPPVDLMVVSRARRPNAGNRMSTLLAQSAQEPEEEWGEEWADAPNEEEFVGDDANEHDDYNLDSSSSDDEEDEDADQDAGEKELRKAERQERTKKRKSAANPFAAAHLAAASRKRVKLDVPSSESAPRPKKKSERASWIPTEEEGPTRTSSRRQTVANKQSTLAKLKEKDRRRDDTLAMMKAAEARKAKDEPKPLTQAERLAEAARLEKLNSKSLHRWEEEEEMRAAERQAKIDALKNRQIDGPFVRYYSGPAIWVDDKIKHTGKDAPSLESLEEKLNKDSPTPTAQDIQSGTGEQPALESNTQIPGEGDQDKSSQDPTITTGSLQAQSSLQGDSQLPLPTSGPSEQNISRGEHSPYSSTMMMAPPGTVDPFLFGMEQYAHPEISQPEYGPMNSIPPHSSHTHTELPPNPFLFTSPFSQAHPSLNDPILSQDDGIQPSSLLAQFQHPPPPPPPAPPAPPKRKVISRALRNLLILCSFPNLDATAPISGRVKAAASVLKEKDRASLIQLSTSLFNWSPADATAFVNMMLNAPKTKKEKEALARPRKELCAVSNKEARYRDPETGIAYHDSRAFGVLRGVVGGGFVWCGEAGCYVGGRAKPMVGMGKGFLGMAPARGVPKRFLEMQRESSAAAAALRKPPLPQQPPAVEQSSTSSSTAPNAGGQGAYTPAASTPSRVSSAPEPVKPEEPAVMVID